MKAGQIVAPERIEIVEAERPDLALERSDPSALQDKVLVRTLSAAVCGSDHPLYLGSGSYPAEPGMSLHESVGIVERSWSDRCKPGDLILALPIESNAMAEYFLGTGPSVVRLPVESGLPREQLLMAQPLGTVLYCLRKLGHWFNAEVAIVGQGPMGLLFTGMMRNMGAALIIGIDRHENRLEASRRMGATHTIHTTKTDPVEAVREITEGRLADLVIEVVGEEDTFNLCIKLARINGHFINFGVPRQSRYTVDFGVLFRKNLKLTTSVGPDVDLDFPRAMQLIAEKRLDVSPLITHILPFAHSQEAFQLSTRRKHEAIKVVVDFEEKAGRA
ncbi:MAG: zinc-binding dehydrogenase [candidate division Zixibacteria bacterium]|nr:zinc-binding dehydrogenase [candidate division Zixibacteria bacterium]